MNVNGVVNFDINTLRLDMADSKAPFLLGLTGSIGAARVANLHAWPCVMTFHPFGCRS